MKTIFIWDTLGEGPITFFAVEGNYSKFDGVYVNSYKRLWEAEQEEGYEELTQELCDFVFTKDGEFAHNVYSHFPMNEFDGDIVFVITAGFIP